MKCSILQINIMCLNWYHKWFTWDHWQRLSWFPQSHRERWSKWITVPINFILKPQDSNSSRKRKKKKTQKSLFPHRFPVWPPWRPSSVPPQWRSLFPLFLPLYPVQCFKYNNCYELKRKKGIFSIVYLIHFRTAHSPKSSSFNHYFLYLFSKNLPFSWSPP